MGLDDRSEVLEELALLREERCDRPPHVASCGDAVAAFRDAPDQVACFQARLNVYNAGVNWLTRMFALDHSSASACIRLTIAAFVALYTA